MNKIIYNGFNRGGMVSAIHMECDTSSFTYKLNDEELIKAFKEIFAGNPNMLAKEDLPLLQRIFL
jgi:hypothetical protein